MGSIIRSADALGCDGIIVTEHFVYIYDPEIIVASMESYFAVNKEKMEENQQVTDFINNLRKTVTNLQVIATTEEGESNIRHLNCNLSTILLMGNESDALSMFYWEICNKKVKITKVGEASSLNLACATNVFLYEVFSQRHK